MITPSGVVATPTLGVTSDGGACRWYMRDDQNYPGAKAPVLLFLHGGGGDETAFEYVGWNTLRNSLLEAGWAIVEGFNGGWGGPAGQARYLEMWDWVHDFIVPQELVILGQSMGGIGAYNLAAQSRIADRHSGVIIYQGTTDLIKRYADHNRPQYGPLNRAFGVPGTTFQPELFNPAAAPYDPMQFSHSVWEGKRVRQVMGAQDTSVAPEAHGLAWIDKYGDSTLETSVHINDPGGHSPLPADQQATFQWMQGLLDPPTPPTSTPQLDHVFMAGEVVIL